MLDKENVQEQSVLSDICGYEYKLLTPKEIVSVNKCSPIWRRLRIGLLVASFVFWLALLLALILIVVLYPKCPHRPRLNFWQSEVGYAVDPFAFKDTNDDYIGDLNGVRNKLSYIQKDIGAGFIILTALNDGYFTNQSNKIGQIKNFSSIDPALGTADDFNLLLQKFQKQNMKVIVPVDMSATVIGENHTLFDVHIESANSESEAKAFRERITKIVKTWMELKVDGILLRVPVSKRISDVPRIWELTYDLFNQIRSTVDGFNSASSNPRAFFVEPLKLDEEATSTQFLQLLLQQNTENGAQLVFDTRFLDSQDINLCKPGDNSSKEISVAYPTGRLHKPRSFNLISTALSFLTIGTPIIYYGTEIGFTCESVPAQFTQVYPMQKEPSENIDRTYLLPMPWDRSGVGFTDANETIMDFQMYTESCKVNATVLSSMSSSEENTNLSLIQRLVELKKSPSIIFGDFFVKYVSTRVISSGVKYFVRRAKGFPAFVIVTFDPHEHKSSIPDSVLDFSDLCAKVKTRLVFPPLSHLKESDEVESHQVYIKSLPHPTIYVFECI